MTVIPTGGYRSCVAFFLKKCCFYSLMGLYFVKVPLMDTMGVYTKSAKLREDCSSFNRISKSYDVMKG